ncbi:hypothetical protein RIF29_42335 [Crotalaria pallida]|uniref:SLC26A/SulP transporter domain-containing protein n=1 Tax=Crotalaria pallida TaxID=3830 RepID=A0AAN9E8Y4_CROPI
MAMSAIESCKVEDHVVVDTEKNTQKHSETSQWVLNAPDPPTLWHQLVVYERFTRRPNYCKSLHPSEIAIGPVAVVSLLLTSMIQKLIDPATDPVGYRKLVFTATLFAGIFQAAFGLFRLGFFVDFLSHAAIVGFMAGAAIITGLQQLKGLLGINHFTNKTDIISVMNSVRESVHHPGKRNRKLFWLLAISPLISVILATLIVFAMRADKNGVNIVKHIKGGLNPISINEIELNSPHVGALAKIGLVVAAVALTESVVVVGRSFASMKGYHLDGNKEMMSLGFMNIIGCFTSCYVATGQILVELK